MLSIWPENQPMSRVAEFACCAILDFRSPSGNDYDNLVLPSGTSNVALAATSDLAANAALSLLSLKHTGTAAGIHQSYHKMYQGQQGNRNRANIGSGRAAGFGSGTNPPAQGTGFGHTGNRPSGNW